MTEPTKVMTAKACGFTYEQMIEKGWTDYTLVEHGMMEPRATGHDTASDDRYRILVERIERVEQEQKALADDKRDIYAELKAVGYDPTVTRQIIKLRKMKPDDRHEMEMVLDTYKTALGMG